MEALLISVGIVIIVSAFCSLFEAVFLSVPIGHIENLAQEGQAAGRIFRRLKQPQNADRALTAILSLNTFANTGGAVVAGAAFTKVFGEEMENYFTIGMMFAVLFFSEVVPKTIGFVFTRPLSNLIARPLNLLIWIFTPLIWISSLLTRTITRGEMSEQISEEELISMARIGRRSGSIEASEARVIQNVLSLKSKTAQDVMTPRTVVFSLQDQLTLEEARSEAGTWPHSRVPVYANDFEDIVGIILRRDVLTALAENKEKQKLSELMRPVHFVAEAMALDRILEMFLERRQHLFVVIDEYGGLAGVLTLEDVLEEILGTEIVDELDQVTDMRELARRRRQQTQQRPSDS